MNPARFQPPIDTTTVRKPSLPLKRLAFEAETLAGFVDAHWEPRRAGRAQLPGLRAAAGAAGLEQDIAQELRDLAAAVRAADAELLATKTPATRLPRLEGRRALRELRTPLRFSLASRAATRRTLVKLDELARPGSAYALAFSLDAHAALAEKHAADLARLSDFDADLPERARRLAHTLREPRRDPATADARHAKLHGRDALMTELMDRMRTVRALARFVFRDHPQILRKATSEYERKRRRKSRKRRGQTAG